MCKHSFVQVALDIEAKRAWVQCALCKEKLPDFKVVSDWEARQFVISQIPTSVRKDEDSE